MRRVLSLVIAVGMLALMVGPVSAKPTLTPTALAPLSGFEWSHVNAINNQGVAVGFSGAGPYTATMWDRLGNPTALAPLVPDVYNSAEDINDRGVIVGYSGSTATIWDSPDSPRALDLPEDITADSSKAFGINSRGDVVGTVFPSSGPHFALAVVWKSSGDIVVLDSYDPALSDSYAYAINDRGVVVGRSTWNNGNVGSAT
ncbi:MAG: hypothetical protein OEM39_06050, partial [Acidimicrobiia bacterium]|nr:hypothetical protein [Acidimicrobiia bacterium]